MVTAEGGDTYLVLGGVLEKMGRHRDATRAFHDSALVLQHLGIARAAMHDYDTAFKYMKEALRLGSRYQIGVDIWETGYEQAPGEVRAERRH